MHSIRTRYVGRLPIHRSTRPAISSTGVRGWGEGALILIEVYADGVDFGILSGEITDTSSRASSLPCRQCRLVAQEVADEPPHEEIFPGAEACALVTGGQLNAGSVVAGHSAYSRARYILRSKFGEELECRRMMKRSSADALAGPGPRSGSLKPRHAGRSCARPSGAGASLIFSSNSAPPTSPLSGLQLSLQAPKPGNWTLGYPLLV